MQKFTKEEKEMLALGLEMYRAKLKGMLNQSEAMHVAVDEIKERFLDAEKLYSRITTE